MDTYILIYGNQPPYMAKLQYLPNTKTKRSIYSEFGFKSSKKLLWVKVGQILALTAVIISCVHQKCANSVVKLWNIDLNYCEILLWQSP